MKVLFMTFWWGELCGRVIVFINHVHMNKRQMEVKYKIYFKEFLFFQISLSILFLLETRKTDEKQKKNSFKSYSSGHNT